MIRVALLGTWHVHAADYARQLAECTNAELSVVWDADPSAAVQFAASWGAQAAHGLDDVLERASVDAVIVADAPSRKEHTVRLALAAGKHVLAEKLLAYSVDGARKLAAIAAESGVVLEVAMPFLEDEVVRAARAFVEDRDLGEVTAIRIRHSIDGLTSGWLPSRFMDAREALVGCLGDLGCHGLYIIDDLLHGEVPESVAASMTIDAASGLDTSAATILSYARRGVIAVLEASEVGAAGSNILEIEITGRDGLFAFGADQDDQVRSWTPEFGWERQRVARAPWASVRGWLASIEGSRRAPGLDSAIRLTDTVVRAYESARRGGTALPFGSAKDELRR